MKKFIATALIASIAISAVSMTACNKNDDNTSQQQQSSTVESSVNSVEEISSEPSKPEITSAQIASLSTRLSSYKSVPKFTCKSDTIDAENISKNAKIAFIADDINNSYSSLVSKQFSTAAKSAGFKKVIIADTDTTPASYNDALSAAVTDKDKVAVMFGEINKDSISPQIELTQANGIKVISGGNAGLDESEHFVDNTVPIDFESAGQLLADWAIVQKKGKVNALALNCIDSGSSNAVYKGFKKEFETYVASGYCTALNISSADIGNGLSSKIKDEITNDTNLNYIIVFDESMLNDTISAVEQSGKSIKIIATGGSPETFTAAENKQIEMLVAQSYEWTAYAMVDYALRVMAKAELPKKQDVPLRIVTSEAIKKDLEENNNEYDFYEICFGAAFVEGYSNLWDL
ncbi:MAG: substrate-binding domain-containing protein [Clostridia bacterium]|nr:substrate-binding domain-containing protein [Clostridia bacterium]